jgi:hypothetical protein
LAHFHITLDALIFAVPMVLILFVCFFRLDELIAKPKKFSKHTQRFSGTDEEGHAICLEPDGHCVELDEHSAKPPAGKRRQEPVSH